MKPLCLGFLSAALLFKRLECNGFAGTRLIPNGVHITLHHASGFTAAEVTHVGNIIVELYGADWAELLTGAAGNAQGRGNNYLAVDPDLNGGLGTSGTVTLLALPAHHRIVNAHGLDLDHLYSCPALTDAACMKKRAIDLAPKASGTLPGIYPDH
jgi:hypothetical protein